MVSETRNSGSGYYWHTKSQLIIKSSKGPNSELGFDYIFSDGKWPVLLCRGYILQNASTLVKEAQNHCKASPGFLGDIASHNAVQVSWQTIKMY